MNDYPTYYENVIVFNAFVFIQNIFHTHFIDYKSKDMLPSITHTVMEFLWELHPASLIIPRSCWPMLWWLCDMSLSVILRIVTKHFKFLVYQNVPWTRYEWQRMAFESQPFTPFFRFFFTNLNLFIWHNLGISKKCFCPLVMFILYKLTDYAPCRQSGSNGIRSGSSN